ncbi:hypothetical protein XA68_10265 [Ophiocordyceps unilateralis]|uniref:Protein-lysine N-methyltransferase EFM5 n=1 Tax=Ophiocordyceps unilateralis TaxID=268505 RepID=A0A2A9P2W8_OPHUN|nr:hypothetical protein XA68_10265 [Ophiocordyceps unilateralis]
MDECNDECNDENITLSGQALTALAEFNAQRHVLQTEFTKLRADVAQGPLSIEVFPEDWNESQFWYSEETAHILASQLVEGSTDRTRIGLVSAPSVFLALKKLLHSRQENERPELVLLEHDKRFDICDDFVYYDYQEPLHLPACLGGSMDRILCDPPFLSEECQTKVAATVRWLLKSSGAGLMEPRVVICTGERMRQIVTRLYQRLGVVATTFEPKHARELGNEFLCYANFQSSSWTWRLAEVDEASGSIRDGADSVGHGLASAV